MASSYKLEHMQHCMSSTGSVTDRNLAHFEREKVKMSKDRVKALRAQCTTDSDVCLHALCKQTVDEGNLAFSFSCSPPSFVLAPI